MGTQKNRLNETVLFSTPKLMLKLMGKKILTDLHLKNRLSKPVIGLNSGYCSSKPTFCPVLILTIYLERQIENY